MTDFLFPTKHLLRRRLSGHSLPEQCRADMQQQQIELSALLRRTVDYGESNSVLIVGMKGSGKSTLIRKCLLDINVSNKQFLVVNLNGFLQTDDRYVCDDLFSACIVFIKILS